MTIVDARPAFKSVHHVGLIVGIFNMTFVKNGCEMMSVYHQKLGVIPLNFQMLDIQCVHNEFANICKGKYLII